MSSKITAEQAREKIEQVAAQPKKVLFGLDNAIDDLTLAMFTLVSYDGDAQKTRGQAHTLFMDVPGVGKTGLIRAISYAVSAKSEFIPGEPTKMPKDIVGGERFDPKTGEYYEIKGPTFAHIVLFDEINRNHPKSMPLVLQLMEERRAIITVTDRENQEMKEKAYPLFPVDGDYENYKPGDPLFFWVLATANPIEMGGEGAYNIPEALMDRFTFSMSLGYPDRDSEKMVRPENVMDQKIEQVINPAEVLEIANFIVDKVEMSERASEYIMNLIGRSRPSEGPFPYTEDRFCDSELEDYINENVGLGISTRVNFHFVAAARTAAFMDKENKENLIYPKHVKRVAHLVMDHRIIRSNSATARKVSTREIVDEILDRTHMPS